MRLIIMQPNKQISVFTAFAHSRRKLRPQHQWPPPWCGVSFSLDIHRTMSFLNQVNVYESLRRCLHLGWRMFLLSVINEDAPETPQVFLLCRVLCWHKKPIQCVSSDFRCYLRVPLKVMTKKQHPSEASAQKITHPVLITLKCYFETMLVLRWHRTAIHADKECLHTGKHACFSCLHVYISRPFPLVRQASHFPGAPTGAKFKYKFRTDF